MSAVVGVVVGDGKGEDGVGDKGEVLEDGVAKDFSSMSFLLGCSCWSDLWHALLEAPDLQRDKLIAVIRKDKAI